MSGGSMEYVGSRIAEAARYVREKLDCVQQAYKGGDFGDVVSLNREYAVKYYGDRPEYKDEKSLCEGVIKRLKDAEIALKKAAIYAERIEWWTSGDDGADTLIARLDEELKELREADAEGAEEIKGKGAGCTTRY